MRVHQRRSRRPECTGNTNCRWAAWFVTFSLLEARVGVPIRVADPIHRRVSMFVGSPPFPPDQRPRDAGRRCCRSNGGHRRFDSTGEWSMASDYAMAFPDP